MNSIETILEVSRRMENGRTFGSVADAVFAEAQELGDEIWNVLTQRPEGEDGVLGEGVDVILCVVDLIYKHNPNITVEEIHKKIEQKLAKWQRKYGNLTGKENEIQGK